MTGFTASKQVAIRQCRDIITITATDNRDHKGIQNTRTEDSLDKVFTYRLFYAFILSSQKQRHKIIYCPNANICEDLFFIYSFARIISVPHDIPALKYSL